MQDGSWERDDAHALGVFLNGGEIPTHDRDGRPIEGHSFLLLLNAHHEPLQFTIPQGLGDCWTPVIASDDSAEQSGPVTPGDELSLCDRSLVILRRD